MTRTPRTEDAWRDATMSPANLARQDADYWRLVAHAMYEFAQTLESREENERWSRLVESLRDDLRKAEIHIAELSDENDKLKDELKEAVGE